MPHAQFKFSPILHNSVINTELTLRNLKSSKATRLDKTPAKILNCLWIPLHPHSRSSLICPSWCRAILPVVSKAFEKEVFCQLYSYLTENLVLSKKGLRVNFIREIFGWFVWETGRFCGASRRVAISVHWRKKNFSSELFIFPPQKEAVLKHTCKRKDYNSVVTLENFYLTSGLWYAHFKMTILFEKGQLVNRGIPSQCII